MLGRLSVILTLLLPLSFSVFAQHNHSVNIDIAEVMNLKLVNGTAGIRTINLDNATDITDGKTLPGAAVVQIQSNQNWKLMVSAGFPLFSYYNVSNPVNPNMPASVLQFRESGTTDYEPLSYTTPYELTTGTPGDFTDDGNEISVDYLADPGFAYPEGLYFINVFYTVSAQ